MTPAEQIERDRRRREDELIILLLLLAEEARRDTVAAIRHGFDEGTVLRNTFTRAVPIIAGSMAAAHADAFRRVGRIYDVPLDRVDAGPTDELMAIYRPAATAAADAMIETLNDEIRTTRAELPDAGAKKIAWDAFETAGYARTNSHGLDLGTERAIVTASNAGMLAAAIAGGATGLRHITVNDGRETDICHERINLQLPIDHPYWLRNCPQLHWRCRSTLVPIFGAFEPSAVLPVIPPIPGFGAAPPGLFPTIRKAA